ncbi:hypothetical protein [Xanthomonas axonopodis]|uniref:hypothetical protein n=1 Tax=Xanthomonas axonopodis TaxID=53413 RepID=UPI003556967C
MARIGQLSFLGRAFASAIARRLAYGFVAISLSWCGIDHARAAACDSASEQCSQGDAYAAAAQLASSRGPDVCKLVGNKDTAYTGPSIEKDPGNSTLEVTALSVHALCSNGAVPFLGNKYYYVAKSCDKEPAYTGGGPWGTYVGSARSGSIGCRNGCDGVWFGNGDDSMTWQATGAVCPADPPKACEGMKGYVWNRYLGVCEPTPPEKCPEGQSKNAKGTCEPNACPEGMVLGQDGTCKPKDNECPSGQIKSPTGSCLPGDGQCASGEVRGADGTCKKDGDGDGEPDGEGDGEGDPDKSQFSGGDDCNTPPSCSGDAIMCGQARIQWRIDCNTRRNRNVSGGTCASMPVCTGEKCDAMEYNSMVFQWRSACAAEKLLAKGTGDGGSNGEQPAWTKVGGMSQDPGAGASADDTKVLTTKKISTDDLDQSGFGGGGSCPGFEAASGGVIANAYSATFASPPPMWCTYIARLRAGLIVVSACVSVFILSRGVG